MGSLATGAGDARAIIEVSRRRRFTRHIGLGLERVAAIGTPIILIIALVWIWFPLVDLAFMSVNKVPERGIPTLHVTWTWYRQLFQQGTVSSSLWSSVELALVVGVIVAVPAVFGAWKFLDLRTRAQSRVLGVLLIPVFVPGLVFGFAMLIYASALGFPQGYMTLAAVHIGWAFPFSFLAALIGASRFDRRLLAAASDLGASRWQRFRDVELPLLRGTIVAAFLFGFLLSFDELPRSLLIGGQVQTLPLYVWAEDYSRSSNIPITYALTTLIMLGSLVILAVAFWFLFRGSERE